MKTITIINWFFIALYGVWILFTFLGANRPGNDAAGRGMETGFAILFGFVLAALTVLNVLPYRASKIIALSLFLLPLVSGLLSGVWHLFELRKERKDAEAAENGSFYFEDESRRELAAAISAGDVAQLQRLLQKPQPLIDEAGHQSTTLLDFAATKTIDNPKPEPAFACLELLLAHGATIQGADSTHQPTHFTTCQRGSAVLLDWFLKKGADPNVKMGDFSPIIFEVMKYGPEPREKVKRLLDHGADPNKLAASSGYGEVRSLYSPLLFAAHKELWEVCQLLLERGADPAYQVPDEQEMIRIMKQTSYYAGPTEGHGDNLQKIMERAEKSYTESGTIPAGYVAFKQFLKTYSVHKS